MITAGGIDPGELAPVLVPALKSEQALPENPHAYQRLQDSIAAATSPPQAAPVSPLPETGRKISGRTYQPEDNKLGVKTLSLKVKKPNTALFGVSLAQGHFVMPVGLDGVYRFSLRGPSNLLVALKGFWQADHKFVLDYNEVARINNFRLSMTLTPSSGSSRASI